jgi:hypothetical protein
MSDGRWRQEGIFEALGGVVAAFIIVVCGLLYPHADS